ncbi:11S globulin seed storage protein 2-like [Primulina huaijiensis]|uniref:11S globulin seed storage protein 2-like n=1 Tax=Primulina huaijiensis TaxID=1492673 RepID=UPI003CC72CE5
MEQFTATSPIKWTALIFKSPIFNHTIRTVWSLTMVPRFLLALSLSLLVSSSFGERTPFQLTEKQQCRLQRITAAQPSQRIRSEGGETELWNERDDQFQCAGVVAMRNILRPNALSLPNFHPYPRLVFIEQGYGYISVTCPVFEMMKAFYLAGGVPKKGQQEGGRFEEETFHNILKEFDTNLLAEAFDMPEEIVRQMQKGGEERGLSVIAQEKMSFIRPDEQEGWGKHEERYDNGLEETYCSMKISTNVESRREADIYSRQAGKLNVADKHKLPILKFLDMSAERGDLFPNALLSPDWSMQGHTIVYVTRGDAQIQISNHNGETLMNDKVNKGDMFVVPQYYVSTARAGESGFEWVAFKTTGWPIRNPLAGYTSVIRGLPLQVITNSYQISPKQAEGLKMNRGGQSFLMSPGRERQF